MIKQLSRGTIVFEFEGKTVTLQGEALLRGHGSPDYVVYCDSCIAWEPPHQDEALDDATRQRLFDALLDSFAARKMTAELE